MKHRLDIGKANVVCNNTQRSLSRHKTNIKNILSN